MASRGVNKAIVIGNLGSDPEIRYTATGTAVANVNAATTELSRNKETGEQVEHTEWHRIVFFGRLAEVVGEYLRKGSKVYVEGRMQTRKWQDKEGHDRYTTEIVANEMRMLDSRGGGSVSVDTPAPPVSASAPSPHPSTAEKNKPEDTNDFDDDIPF